MSSAVAERREARTNQILECAWRLAAEHGIAGLSLHTLAREVGIRQPSLYGYFTSKNALYDAMFAAGNRQLLARLHDLDRPDDPRDALKALLHTFIGFALEDPARCELLFERHLPGFAPSPDSYAIAQEALAVVTSAMRRAGVTAQGDIDCMVAITAGLMEAQLANDPGGTRWVRHLDRLVDLYLDDLIRRRKSR